MKKLFNDNENYTEESLKIDSEFYAVIIPILKRYAEQGYSVRELSYIAQNAVRDVELGYLIDKGSKIAKQLEEKRKKEI